MTKTMTLIRNAMLAMLFDACMFTLAIVLFVKAHYCARHSFATWLGAEGASTKEIMEAGSWRDYRAVLRYTSVDEKRVRATVNRIKI